MPDEVVTPFEMIGEEGATCIDGVCAWPGADHDAVQVDESSPSAADD